MNILCIGDSNTWGFSQSKINMREPERWTILLEKLLNNKLIKIKEDGQNGRTIYSNKNKNLSLKHNLETTLKKYDDIDIVLVMLGTNDCSISENKNVEEVIIELDALLKRIENHYIENFNYEPIIAFITPPKINKKIKEKGIAFDNFDLESYNKLLKFNRNIEKYLNEENPSVYVLNTTSYIEAGEVDCIHIEQNTHRLLAEKIHRFLEETILNQ